VLLATEELEDASACIIRYRAIRGHECACEAMSAHLLNLETACRGGEI
jgi:hypothetical protein